VEEATEMTARGVDGCWPEDGRPAVISAFKHVVAAAARRDKQSRRRS
jgi:hypothetical protein